MFFANVKLTQRKHRHEWDQKEVRTGTQEGYTRHYISTQHCPRLGYCFNEPHTRSPQGQCAARYFCAHGITVPFKAVGSSAISARAPTLPRAYPTEPVSSSVPRPDSKRRTHHMSSLGDRGIRQSLCTSRLPDHAPIHLPIPQRLTHKRRLATPGHLECPALIADPVTDPVVRANIDKHADTTLEELRKIGVGLVIFVQRIGKRIVNGVIAGLEIRGDFRAHAELLADGRIGKVIDQVSESPSS